MSKRGRLSVASVCAGAVLTAGLAGSAIDRAGRAAASPLRMTRSVSALTTVPASAAKLPTVLATSRWCAACDRQVGVYRVRPHKMDLIQAVGGELVLHWSSWTKREAAGAGTSYADQSSAITVKALDPVDGRFSTLEISGFGPTVEILKVAGGIAGPYWNDTT